MNINLSSFQNVARFDNVCIKTAEDGSQKLKSGFFAGRTIFPWQKASMWEANKETTTQFLAEMRKEYGSSTVDLLDVKISDNPLKGRVIQRLVKQAEEISKELLAFNTNQVKDFVDAPEKFKVNELNEFNGLKGLKALLAERGHREWLDVNKIPYQQLTTMLHEAVEEKTMLEQTTLSHKTIRDIAISVLDRVEELSLTCHAHFNALISILKNGKHKNVMELLDNYAKSINLRAQFDLGVETKDRGADDFQNYTKSVVAESLKPLSADDKANLRQILLNSETGKALSSLFSGGASIAISELLEAGGVNDIEDQSESQKMLGNLFRAPQLFDAILTEVDQQVSGSTTSSRSLQSWRSRNIETEWAGDFADSDPEFVDAFIAFQRERNGIEIDSKKLGEKGRKWEHLTFEQPKKTLSFLTRQAKQIVEGQLDKQLRDDFERSTYTVDGQQISRNRGDDAHFNDINKLPPLASYFAHHGLFGGVWITLLDVHNLNFIGDGDRPSLTKFDLSTETNGDIYLRATNEQAIKFKSEIKRDEDGNIDYAKSVSQEMGPDSTLRCEINLLIRKVNDRVTATLTSPVYFDYYAKPTE
ncbi:MAG: hypothetical protein RLY17_1085 [Pseudomonadota bacterium]|jgi:hypothetical protein